MKKKKEKGYKRKTRRKEQEEKREKERKVSGLDMIYTENIIRDIDILL